MVKIEGEYFDIDLPETLDSGESRTSVVANLLYGCRGLAKDLWYQLTSLWCEYINYLKSTLLRYVKGVRN